MHKPVIIGAGIAGLTLGVALRHRGIACEMCEAAPALEPIGAGIWMAPNAMQVFARLGLADEVSEAGVEIERVCVTTAGLRTIGAIDLAGAKKKFGYKIISIQRAQLHRILIAAFGGGRVHLGKRLRSIEEIFAEPRAAFEDGTSASGSILIGADGTRSAARQAIFGDRPMRRTGQMCWRGLADFELPETFRGATFEMWARASRMGIADVGHGKAYWFLVNRMAEPGRPASATTRGQLIEIARDFPPAASRLIEATPAAAINQVELADLPPRLPWSRGNVCLIGDAAHPTTPNLGQGGAQAVEDAYCLARMLSEQEDAGKAFEAFQARRFAKVRSIVNTSYRAGRLIHAGWPRVRNFVFGITPRSVNERAMERLYDVSSSI